MLCMNAKAQDTIVPHFLAPSCNVNTVSDNYPVSYFTRTVMGLSATVIDWTASFVSVSMTLMEELP